jgi:hypothetical protein
MSLTRWLGMVKTVFTDEDKRNLRGIALELNEIRKLIEKLAETLVNLSDKELLRTLNADRDGLKEKQVDDYKETLEKQLYTAEKEFQS